MTVILERPAQPLAARRTKRLLVGSAKGGTGKTTTSYNIAAAAALDGLDVATVDCDKQGSLSKVWAKRPDDAASIGHYQATMQQVDEILGLTGHDLVIIDTPPGVEQDPADIRRRVRTADFVLIPTQQSGLDLDETVAWMRLVRDEGVEAAFLMNAVNRRANSYERARKRLNKEGSLAPIDVPRFEDIPNAIEVGMSVIEVKGCKGADDYLAVWDFIRRSLGF
jgi:chromosome partitioning protein